jgi:hypothetical protein
MPEHSREDRIRLKAYQIWVAEGMPRGRDFDHWALAEETIDREDAAPEIQLADATAASGVERVASFGQHADAAAELHSGDKPAVNGRMHLQGIGG